MDRPITDLRDEFPWTALGKGKVVDAGGGNGSISMMLAKEFPDLDFVVQDISQDMMRQASTRKEMEGLEGRVTFMQHDFFEAQPIHDAKAYFIRHVTHNYVDGDCIKILRAFIPALEKSPGTPLLINDTILPELNQKPKFDERISRQADMAMFVVLGAKQRSATQFWDLLKAADERFEVRRQLCGPPKGRNEQTGTWLMRLADQEDPRGKFHRANRSLSRHKMRCQAAGGAGKLARSEVDICISTFETRHVAFEWISCALSQRQDHEILSFRRATRAIEVERTDHQ